MEEDEVVSSTVITAEFVPGSVARSPVRWRWTDVSFVIVVVICVVTAVIDCVAVSGAEKAKLGMK